MERSNNAIRSYNRAQMFWCKLEDDAKGSEQKGDRIIVIIQNDKGNKFSPCVIGAIGTAQIHKAKTLPTHVLISSNKYNDLPRDTVIMAEQVRTLDKCRLGDCIGELDEEDMQKVDIALKVSMDLQDKEEHYIENIEKLKLELIELDGYIKRCIYKGTEIIKLKNDMFERESLICRLKTECEKHSVSYEEKYNDTIIPEFLMSVARGNKYNKEMVG